MVFVCFLICSILFPIFFIFFLACSLKGSQEGSGSHYRLLLLSFLYLVLSVALSTKALENTKPCKTYLKTPMGVQVYGDYQIDEFKLKPGALEIIKKAFIDYILEFYNELK